MRFTVLDKDFEDFVVPLDNEGTKVLGSDINESQFATPKGNIRFREFSLPKELTFLEGMYCLQDDLSIQGKGNADLLEIQFNLSNQQIHYQDKLKQDHYAGSQSGNIVFLSAEENQAHIHMHKDVVYHTFDVHLPLSFFNAYAGESRMLDNFLESVFKKRSTSLSKHNIQMSSKVYNLIKDIKNCIFDGLTRKIYLESKVYELVSLLYEQAENLPDLGRIELTGADTERIRLAAVMIRDNIEKPYTILQLSRQVGINQTKLKAGFKQLFGTTIFGYLQDIRMDQAKAYLLDTRLSIQEIGLLLGYQSTSNFSIAFKKTFGYSPMKLRDNKA